MVIPLTSTSLPVGTMPRNSLWWVPRNVMRLTTLSPPAIWSSMLRRKPGKAERNSPTKEALYVLGAALERRAVGLVGDVAVEDLVGDLESALIKDLLNVTPEDGLVLFF